MSLRKLLSVTVVPGIFLVTATAAYADKSHDGKVVSVTEGNGTAAGTLVMSDKQGKNVHNHSIASSVKITRNDKTAKLGDLKKGDSITVTTADDGSVNQVAATDAASSGTAAGAKDSDAKTGARDILKGLDLSSDQQKKIDEIVSKYGDECESAWKEFSDRYQETIRMESAMMAAIEEHFSDGQRKHLREQRHRAAHSRKHPASKVDTTLTREPAESDGREELLIVGIRLTPRQQESAERVRTSYADRLGTLNDEIERLHARMIALETEKLLDIEDVLTKEQREKLRKDHEKLTQSTDDTSDKSKSATK